MRKRIITALLGVVLAAGLTGCKDYRGLNELSIVAGIAIDKSKTDPAKFHLTFEIVDTGASADKKGKQTLVAEAEGMTIFEAIGNANEQLAKDMYFGNAELLVIHEDVARDVGINNIIEPVIRDYSIRDTMMPIISRDESAGKILAISAEKDKIVSYDIANTLDWHKTNANSTRTREIYEIYEDLKRGTDCISIPAYEMRENGGSEQPELNGLAVFQGDRLAGYLESESVPYFLCLAERLGGGTFAFYLNEELFSDVTLQILESKPKLGHRVEKDGLVLTASVELAVSVSSYSPYLPKLGEEMIIEVQKRAEQELDKRIRQTVEEMQRDMGCDIFGFGQSIYRADPAYWNTVRDDWEAHFREAGFEIQTEVAVRRTGTLTGY